MKKKSILEVFSHFANESTNLSAGLNPVGMPKSTGVCPEWQKQKNIGMASMNSEADSRQFEVLEVTSTFNGMNCEQPLSENRKGFSLNHFVKYMEEMSQMSNGVNNTARANNTLCFWDNTHYTGTSNVQTSHCYNNFASVYGTSPRVPETINPNNVAPMPDIVYIPYDKMKVQGSWKTVYRRYGKKWRIIALGKGNGNWLLYKLADVLVNGKSFRDFVLSHYHEEKLTEDLVDRFRNDVFNGEIQLPL